MADTNSDRIQMALADPDAPWYGSDLVSWVADLLDSHRSLESELAEARREAERLTKERDEIRILAERAYPALERSGFCSRHHPRSPEQFECETCYPNLRRLIDHHMVVFDRLYMKVLDLAGVEDPPNGRYGTDPAIELIRQRLALSSEGATEPKQA